MCELANGERSEASFGEEMFRNRWIWFFKNGGMKISKERSTSSTHFPQFGRSEAVVVIKKLYT